MTHQHHTATATPESDWNPYLVVLDHETIPEAAARHRRQTGHRGPLAIIRHPAWSGAHA